MHALCASVDHRASKHSALLSEVAWCFYQKKQLPSNMQFHLWAKSETACTADYFVKTHKTEDLALIGHWVTLDLTTVVHYFFPLPSLIPHSSVCLVLGETKPPGHMRPLVLTVMGMIMCWVWNLPDEQRIKQILSFQWKISVILVFLNHTFISLLLVFFFFLNKLPY